MYYGQSGLSKNMEVTREERQFILAICEEFAKNKSPKIAKTSATAPSFQAAMETAEGAIKNKR